MLADEIKLTKGFCLIAGAGGVIVNFIFLFAVLTVIGDRKQPELNAIQIGEMRGDVNALNTKLDELNKTLANQAVKDAEVKGRDFGYRMGRIDDKQGH
jgi:hypothetical protein